MALLERTRIVLLNPSLPENVGAIARGMRHFGLAELVLVGGVSPTHSLALAASAGAEAILQAARVVDDFEAALAGTVVAFGTTARPQSGVERRAIAPDEAAHLAAAHAEAGPVALVFGTEKHGMTVAQLRRCDQLVTIPGTEHACLNLAQAFTVMAYEWRRAAASASMQNPPLSAVAHAAGIDDLADTIAHALAAAGVLKPAERESKLHALRRILSGARLTPDEAALLHGLARGYGRASTPRE